jgi:predicted phage gp36 major capsid-like protein
MTEEIFSALDAKVKKALQENQETLNAEMRETVRSLREEEHKLKEEISKLNKDVALYAIDHLAAELLEKYKDLPDVVAYLKEVLNDFVQNLEQFRRKTEAQPQSFAFPWTPHSKYDANIIATTRISERPIAAEPEL